jgi:hypothetical protein
MAQPCVAQALEPRAYSPSPTGTNFFLVSYGRSTGGVLFDPSLPVTDVDARLNIGALAYGRTFGVFDHAASATLAVPYVVGEISGNVGETQRSISQSGMADTKLRLAMNIIGGPALTPAEFAQHTPQTTLGASLSIEAPAGQYDPNKLINIGTNRWAFKPELGVSQPIGRWFVEGYAGVWLFAENSQWLGNNHRQQDPIESLQGHVSYTFRPRLWLAGDATYYSGGRTTVNGTRNANQQANSRIGLTMSIPAGKRQSVKFSWSDGATTRAGGDFKTLGIAWQYAWFD